MGKGFLAFTKMKLRLQKNMIAWLENFTESLLVKTIINKR